MGFLYGDGLFETMRFDSKRIFSIDKHIDRLLSGLNVIDLHLDKDKSDLVNLISLIIAKNNIDSGIIRLMVTRGTSDIKVPVLTENEFLSDKDVPPFMAP